MKENIKKEKLEVDCSVDWIELAQSPLAGSCENCDEPSSSIKRQTIY
jgi:hypothetical protein